MFRKIITLSAVAVCLAAAVLITYNFTKERATPRVSKFICAEVEFFPAKMPDCSFFPQAK